MLNMMDKNTIRRHARRVRQDIPAALRQWKDEQIARRVLGDEGVADAASVCLYWSLPEEVGTHNLVSQCLARGQQVALPCHTGERVLRRVTDPTRDLISGGSLGILEPGDHCKVVEPGSIECFLVPAVALDIYGHRIGFGGGYFDRTLSCMNPQALVAALAYECQMFREVPFDPRHDQPVQRVFTEERIYSHRSSTMEAADIEDTCDLARKLAGYVAAGFRLGLVGPLGAGKTTFIQALLCALGVEAQVTSPTFVLMNEYRGRLSVRHVDLYRIGGHPLGDEDLQMFMETLSKFPGAVVVEWADFAHEWLPLSTPQLKLDFLGVLGRRITLETYDTDDLPLHEVFS